MNYTELVSLVQETAENNEATFVSNIPYFVRRAEERCYRRVKLPALRKAATANITTGDNSIAVPSDFLSVDSFNVLSGGVYTPLFPREPDFIKEAYGTVSYKSKPLCYAVQSNTTITFGPTADQTYEIELNYTYKPESIVDASTTWLGTNAERALFCSTMVEALMFMKADPADIKTWDDAFEEAVGGTKVLAEGKNRTNEWRNSPPRAPQVSN